MSPAIGEQLLRTYVEGWKECDRAKILGTLDPDCVVVESLGAVYRGSARVGEWIDAWFGEGNTHRGLGHHRAPGDGGRGGDGVAVHLHLARAASFI